MQKKITVFTFLFCMTVCACAFADEISDLKTQMKKMQEETQTQIKNIRDETQSQIQAMHQEIQSLKAQLANENVRLSNFLLLRRIQPMCD